MVRDDITIKGKEKKVRVLYVCEICGYKSSDPQKIQECEEQGMPHFTYKIGDLVNSAGVARIINCGVKRVHGIHEPRYQITYDRPPNYSCWREEFCLSPANNLEKA